MNNGDQQTDDRKLKRWGLIYHLRAFDSDNQSMLGHVADITTKGIQLVSNTEIEQRDFHLEMEVPSESGGTEKELLDAQCTWSKLHTVTNLYQSGFRITKASTEAISSIQSLINELESDHALRQAALKG